MLTLTIDNSYSKVTGLNNEQMSELKALLNYEKDLNAAYYGAGRPTRRYLIDKYGTFPSGLLPLVKKWIYLHSFSQVDNRRLPVSTIEFKPKWAFTPYPEQFDAVLACADAHRGTISAVTGFGKSITMAMLITYLGCKTLVIVPNLGLKAQLIATFTELFGNLNSITVENIDSPNLNKPGDYDCLIIDEAHHAAAKTYRTLNKKMWGGIYYRFFFTGTAFRSRDEEQLLLESITGSVIYSIDYHQAVAARYITPVEAYYVDLPKTATDAYTWADVYSSLVVNNANRNRIISDLLASLHRQNLPTLCLVKEIAHGNRIIENLVSDHKFGIPFVQGDNEYNSVLIEAFNAKFKPLLLGTNGCLGEGVDTRPAEYIIIAGLGKSKNQFIQQVGRGLRKCEGKQSCKIILFRDSSHKYTLRHFNAQKKILLDVYGVKPVKLNV